MPTAGPVSGGSEAPADDAGKAATAQLQGDILEQHLHLSPEILKELREAGADLALVAPVLDGRIRDLAKE